MNKTLKAWCMGFVRFDVNGRRFWRYNTAKKYADAIPCDMTFTGYHVFRGRLCFKMRSANCGPTWSTET